MDITKLHKLLDMLEKEQNELSKLILESNSLNLNGNQDGISVRIATANRDIRVTEMDRHYVQQVIRGREMILLGVKKVYHASIESQKKKIQSLKVEIQKETSSNY